MEELIDVPAGLHNVAVTDTVIGDVRGDEGFYHYRQYDATDLARSATLRGCLAPVRDGRAADDGERERFRAAIAAMRTVPTELARTGRCRRPDRRRPVGEAAHGVVGIGRRDRCRDRCWTWHASSASVDARRLAAMVPAVLARLHRRAAGERDRRRPIARSGMPPRTCTRSPAWCRGPTHARALEQYLILTIDHGFNASTFTGRVVASTGASIVDVVCAAIGALAGPLHGGAPSRALDALDAIGTPTAPPTGSVARSRPDAASWASAMPCTGLPIRVRRLLRDVARELGGELVERAMAIESEILATLAELKPDRPLPSNVEFYAGVIMATVGPPREMFTPTFAVSRTIGWCAHALEQADAAKLIRPSARYVGPAPQHVALAQ